MRVGYKLVRRSLRLNLLGVVEVVRVYLRRMLYLLRSLVVMVRGIVWGVPSVLVRSVGTWMLRLVWRRLVVSRLALMIVVWSLVHGSWRDLIVVARLVVDHIVLLSLV